MGFLQNTTNNIIIDAVLTDYGRRALSKNDGSFSIIKFGLGDDEVDYTLLSQYGTQVGKEKIIKNTPIFEAATSATYGIRSHLISSAAVTSNIGYLKNNTTSGAISLDVVTTKSKVITIEQQTNVGDSIPSDLTNQVYVVKLDNKFLSVRGRTPRYVSDKQQAQYFINRDDVINTANGSFLTLELEVKSNITSSTFNTYGTTATSNLIRTYTTITGKESGQSLTVEVKISKS
jgi:hypothetical protein